MKLMTEISLSKKLSKRLRFAKLIEVVTALHTVYAAMPMDKNKSNLISRWKNTIIVTGTTKTMFIINNKIEVPRNVFFLSSFCCFSSTFLDLISTSATKGETLKDTIMMVGNYADVIVMRHFLEGAACYAA